MTRGKITGMASKWRYWAKPTKVGYKRKGYSFKKAVKAYKKTGWFKTVTKTGSGHTAGYRWAEAKKIDHTSRQQRYSKNSPSFDEGVYKWKEEQRHKAKMMEMARKTKTLSFKKQVKTTKNEIAPITSDI